MSIAWPTTGTTLPPIPLFLDGGFTEAPANPVIRSPFEQGPVKARRRFTGDIYNVDIDLFLKHQLQYLDFLNFYNNTIAGGTLIFDWPGWENSGGQRYQFREDVTFAAYGRAIIATMKLTRYP